MSISTYIINDCDTCWESRIEVDNDFKNECCGVEYTTEMYAKESLLFFSGGEDLLEEYNGDVFRAYFKLITPTLMKESLDWNKAGVISQIADMEGWVPLDGSCGIKLVSCDSLELGEEVNISVR